MQSNQCYPIVFYIVDRTCEALADAGVVYTMSKSGRAALFCRDPDGNGIEFMETPNLAESLRTAAFASFPNTFSGTSDRVFGKKGKTGKGEKSRLFPFSRFPLFPKHFFREIEFLVTA